MLVHAIGSKDQQGAGQATSAASSSHGACRVNLVGVRQVVEKDDENKHVRHSKRQAGQYGDDPVDFRSARPREPEHGCSEHRACPAREWQSLVFLFERPGFASAFCVVKLAVPPEEYCQCDSRADGDGEQGEAGRLRSHVVDSAKDEGIGLEE